MEPQIQSVDILLQMGEITNKLGTIEIDILPLEPTDDEAGVKVRIDTPSISAGLRALADAVDARALAAAEERKQQEARITLLVGTMRDATEWMREREIPRRELGRTIFAASSEGVMRGRRGPVAIVYIGDPRRRQTAIETDNVRDAIFINQSTPKDGQ